jgi:Tfp pilus assembly protein PilO
MAVDFRKKIYLKILILIIAIAILVFFGINPIFSQINQISQKIQETQFILSEFDQQKKYLESLENDSEKIEKENIALSQVLIEPQNIVNFIIALERIADITENQMEISVIAPKKENTLNASTQQSVTKDEFYNVPFNLSLEGKFNSLMDFLVLLENMEYYVDVDSINIEAATEQVQLENREMIERYLGIIRTNLSIKVYTNQLPPDDFW